MGAGNTRLQVNAGSSLEPYYGFAYPGSGGFVDFEAGRDIDIGSKAIIESRTPPGSCEASPYGGDIELVAAGQTRIDGSIVSFGGGVCGHPRGGFEQGRVRVDHVHVQGRSRRHCDEHAEERVDRVGDRRREPVADAQQQRGDPRSFRRGQRRRRRFMVVDNRIVPAQIVNVRDGLLQVQRRRVLAFQRDGNGRQGLLQSPWPDAEFRPLLR